MQKLTKIMIKSVKGPDLRQQHILKARNKGTEMQNVQHIPKAY